MAPGSGKPAEAAHDTDRAYDPQTVLDVDVDDTVVRTTSMTQSGWSVLTGF